MTSLLIPDVRGPRLWAVLLVVFVLASLIRPAFGAPPEEATAKAKAALALAGTCADKCPCADKCDCDPKSKCPACPTCSTVAKSPRDSLVRVKSGDGSGSGIVVWTDGKRSVILTAAHVLTAGKIADVRAEGKWHRAEVLASDASADLAALLVSVTLPAAKVAESDPPVGAEVTMYGVTSLWSKGTIDGRESIRFGSGGQGDRYVFKTDPGNDYSDAGDSGGGVFYRGELVGVHCGRSGATQQATVSPYCAGAKSVRALLGGLLQRDGGKTVLAAKPTPPAAKPVQAVPTTTDTLLIRGVLHVKGIDGIYRAAGARR